MAKKDINYIKHIRPQIKSTERSLQSAKESHRLQKIMEIHNRIENECRMEENKRIEVCKKAAKMSNRERLMWYSSTNDSTYLGTNCNWSMLTKMGRDKFGKIIGSFF